MKQEWSRSWLSSVQPRKQRKYRYNAPMHIRHKFMASHLSEELRKNYGKRAVTVRKGDQIEIMRGSSAGLRGMVEEVNLKKGKIYVERIIVKKVDGSEVKIGLEPSNLKIIKLNLDDKARLKALNRSGNPKKVSEKKKEAEKEKEIKEEKKTEEQKKAEKKEKADEKKKQDEEDKKQKEDKKVNKKKEIKKGK